MPQIRLGSGKIPRVERYTQHQVRKHRETSDATFLTSRLLSRTLNISGRPKPPQALWTNPIPPWSQCETQTGPRSAAQNCETHFDLRRCQPTHNPL